MFVSPHNCSCNLVKPSVHNVGSGHAGTQTHATASTGVCNDPKKVDQNDEAVVCGA